MPELPEVEGARRLVQRTVVGKRVAKAVVADDEKVIVDIPPRELEAALVGRTLVAAKRRGKQMWWDFDSGPSLLLHFGMTGGLVVRGIGAAHYKSFAIDDSTWPPRYCKLELHLEDGTQLAFCDSRRFAKVRFLEDPETKPPISELGWDPVLNMPSLEDFAAALAKQRRAVKALLLDQSFSAGVGNYVADEVLFQARVHPEQPAYSIPPSQVAALHATIRDVCHLACEVEADADQFPPDWLFHVRWGKGSSSKSRILVGGVSHTIDHITVGGRTSAVVPALQKLNKAAIAAAAAAAGGKGKSAGTGGKGGKAAAAGGNKRQQGQAVSSEGEEEVQKEQVAAAAADAAVAVAQGAAKPRGRRGGKAAAAQEVAAVAAEVAAEAAQQGRRGRQKNTVAPAAAAAAAAANRGARKFRSQQAADEPVTAVVSGAISRKRKAPAVDAGAKSAASVGSKGAVSRRRTRR